MKPPVVGITLGDPGGVGPEVTFKALAEVFPKLGFIPLVIGSKSVLGLPGMASLTRQLKMQDFDSDRSLVEGTCYFDDIGGEGDPFQLNQTSSHNGQVAYDAICRAVELVRLGVIDRLITAPISKTSLQQAGVPFTGHTTLLAHLTGAENVSMGFYSDSLKTILTTVHIALCEVPSALTHDRLVGTFSNAFLFCRMLGIQNPRIAVAGLNPHASEDGLFGQEESTQITPAIDAFNQESQPHHVQGPIAPDTVYHRAGIGEFDMVVSLYHDQGLIPIKLLAFDRAVNVSVGLPFIRTSPDHGTAFDIAYQDKASSRSMVEAIKLAVSMDSVRKIDE